MNRSSFGLAEMPAPIAYSGRPDWRELLTKYGLTEALPVQYGKYLLEILHGNLGTSFSQSEPVSTVLMSRLPWPPRGSVARSRAARARREERGREARPRRPRRG